MKTPLRKERGFHCLLVSAKKQKAKSKKQKAKSKKQKAKNTVFLYKRGKLLYNTLADEICGMESASWL